MIDKKQFHYASLDSDLWSTSNLNNGTFYIYVPDEEGPITLDGIEEEKEPSTILTAVFDEVDAETEDDRTAPSPIKSMCVRSEFVLIPLVLTIGPLAQCRRVERIRIQRVHLSRTTNALPPFPLLAEGW